MGIIEIVVMVDSDSVGIAINEALNVQRNVATVELFSRFTMRNQRILEDILMIQYN